MKNWPEGLWAGPEAPSKIRRPDLAETKAK